MRQTLIAFALLLSHSLLFSQAPVIISTGSTQLIFTVNREGELMQAYYGKKIPIAGDSLLPGAALPAYPAYGMGQEAAEVALRITHADGNLTTRLVFSEAKQSTPEPDITVTRIRLKDPFYPLEVVLQFRAFQNEDVIEQQLWLIHHEKGEVVLHEAASSGLAFSRASNAYLNYYSGDWANEFNVKQEKLMPGIKIVDSKLGVRVNQHTNPSFLLSLNGPLQEESGPVVAAVSRGRATGS